MPSDLKRRAKSVARNSESLYDANQGYSTADAIKFSHLVADDNLLWFEEPCQWQNDRRAMRDVRFAGGVPVVRRTERVLCCWLSRFDGDRLD